jgi:single-strand selective monofunctional uracil DNA glycosylase
VAIARALRTATARLTFSAPVTHVYRPLEYAWRPHVRYLQLWGYGAKRVLLFGMNPGPWGMAQTGIPFGEVATVVGWLGIEARVARPAREHPQRPVRGFECERSEVSGRRLWGLFAERFGEPAAFFAEHLVLNYCPLLFLEKSGRNRTPNQLPAHEARPLLAACDVGLRAYAELYSPEWVVGVGEFAARRLRAALAGRPLRIGRILHPSPASPAANRGWAAAATEQLEQLGVW